MCLKRQSKKHLSSQEERHVLPAARKRNALRAKNTDCWCALSATVCVILYAGAQCACDKLFLPGAANRAASICIFPREK